MTTDETCVRIENKDQSIEWLKQETQNRKKKYCALDEAPEIDETILIGFLGRFSRQGELVISGVETHRTHLENEETQLNHTSEAGQHNFPNELEEAIINGRAVAAVDASVKGQFMAASWIITAMDNKNSMKWNVHS